MVLQLEKGEEGTPHFQGYVVFKQQKTLGGVRLVNGQAHWGARIRTHEQVVLPMLAACELHSAVSSCP